MQTPDMPYRASLYRIQLAHPYSVEQGEPSPTTTTNPPPPPVRDPLTLPIRDEHSGHAVRRDRTDSPAGVSKWTCGMPKRPAASATLQYTTWQRTRRATWY